ncbi:ABC transporter ATP-binding protein NatA [Burkholderiales bacterium]|nr:MAG: ATP-binding cassette domain-containing protein [Burkholderiales bacterium]CAG0972180.1 ABC transporter ATP-binding protein NatA [Burkholderiales bacterium]
MIEAQGLKKLFGKVAAVEEVSFRAEDGCVTGLLGPNGAGKTTSLRMLCGLVKPDAGSARIDAIDASREPLAARRRMGVLSDSRGLYPRLTARENIRYYGELQGLHPGELAPAIARLADTLGLSDLLDRPTAGFSQGERMKTALARALIHDPRNVLLDEPTNGLDILSTRAVRGLIRRLRDQGRCVLFSSHIMQEVAALCDRVVIIARGRVLAEGSPADILARTGKSDLEEAFIAIIGSEEGLFG